MLKFFRRVFSGVFSIYLRCTVDLSQFKNVNLCSGTQRIQGYKNIDFFGDADLLLNLEKDNLPFNDNSLDNLVCISAINYFTKARATEIVSEVYRVLKVGGVARFGVQDLELIAFKYVNKDIDFFFQKLPNGQDRFEGDTLGDKFMAWFYGYKINDSSCKYFYDYESLEKIFKDVGFGLVEKKNFKESRLNFIDQIDNRPEQMFFLEAVK